MTGAGETGAIHDIGYRRYDGPRLGTAYVARSLFVHSLAGAFGIGRGARSKVAPLLLLGVITVPALVIAAVVIIGRADELPLEYTSYAVRLQLVVSLFAAAQAPQTVSRDLRFGVVPLYFSRPVTPHTYVQAKLLALTAALLCVLAVPLLVLYGGALLAELPFWSSTREVLLALAGATLFALVVAGLGLVLAAFTPRRGLGVAAVVAVLVVLGGVGVAVQGIAQDEGRSDVAAWAGLISPFSLVDGVQVWALGAQSSTVEGPPGTLGGVVFTLVAAAVVLGCYALLRLRYRRVGSA